ncbi:MAG: ATP synthase F1 subunit delta [Defluviitaleaceae bacterium]|nr:ATP synthase F1 subunit delta [Defluviitaleaceae bacterium]
MAKLKPYSEAFFAIALEKNKIDDYEAQANFILEVYKKDPKLKTMLEHPQVTMNQKNTVLKEAFESKVSGDFLSFFALILRKGREKHLTAILEVFLTLCLSHRDTLEAKVFSPTALTNTQENAIKEKLISISGKNILLKTELDPSLIAGLKVIVDGKLIDLSVKKDISNIKKAMKGGHI